MTLESTVNRNRFIGNGSTKTFNFTFKTWKSNQIKVFVGDGETETDMTPYVSVSRTASGGSVTFAKAPTSGKVIVIRRDMPFIQEDDYRNGSRFDAEDVEDRLDQDCAERQDLLLGLERAIKVPETSNASGDQLVAELMQAHQDVLWALQQAGDVTGATLITATGTTTPRSLNARFADIVNVKDFGAKGDGVTDDTNAIQAALDYCGTTRTCFFPDGIYSVTRLSCSCSILGIDQNTAKVVGVGTPTDEQRGVFNITGTNEKSFSNLRVESSNGQDCIYYTDHGRFHVYDIYLYLAGNGVGLHCRNLNTAWSRVVVARNITVRALPPYITTGVWIRNSTDAVLQDINTLEARIAIRFGAGCTMVFMSNVHLWCGDNSKIETDWWNNTKCLYFDVASTLIATNVYLDTACVAVYSPFKSKLYIKNLYYWDDGRYSDDVYKSTLIYQSEGAKEFGLIDVDGGLVRANKNMNHIYNAYNMTISNINVIVESGFSFSYLDQRLPRSVYSKNKALKWFLDGEGYSSIAHVYCAGTAVVRVSFNSTRNTISGTLTIMGLGEYIFETPKHTTNLYYKYNSSSKVMTIFAYHSDDEIVDVVCTADGEYGFIFMENNIYIEHDQGKLQPETQATNTGLTPIEIASS